MYAGGMPEPADANSSGRVVSDDGLQVLALTLVPGFGPVLTRRLIEHMGSPKGVLEAPLASLRCVKGLGDAKARAAHEGMRSALARAQAEARAAADRGVRIRCYLDADFPPLLADLPDAPALLYVRGRFDASGQGGEDRYPIAIVGSRSCTQYGMEQAERFGGALAAAGLTVVSGGARGIDTAAHRAAFRAGGRTVVVLGCGLAHCYPRENAELFDAIVAEGRGAIVSELPMDTAPTPENFPARNRIISGLSLGVLVVEAGQGSGALITARIAVEQHGREVFAIPGRVDSPASRGSLGLLKGGGAALVTEPADIIAHLESPAHHVFRGTHAARFTPAAAEPPALFGSGDADSAAAGGGDRSRIGLTPEQSRILEALAEPRTLDDLVQVLGGDAGSVRADLTQLELRRAVVRRGSMLQRG